MENPPEKKEWQQLARPDFDLLFSYPKVTPEGHRVERAVDERDEAVRVHLTSVGSAELYFEVTRFSDLTPQGEYKRHKPYLEERFGSGAVAGLTEAELNGLPAWSYTFRWDQGERAVYLVQPKSDLYRIVYDPRSQLNMEILATLAFMD